eukprot:Seg2422.1 transcript_id=Seg2422.1/GoldUCD/mRNA.D3Y31 product="Serine/threonine-protein kinase ATR" protein_id=Seg2422.1/GoldUCD/D3Y31
MDSKKREGATTTIQKHGKMEENPGKTGSKDAFYLKLSPVLMALRDNERDIETLSTQEHKMSAQETRNMICECVNNLLTDIPSVAAQLGRETGGTPQSQVVLQFLLHCVDAFPQCYISMETINGGFEKALTEKQGDDVSVDFTKWVISRLLRILTASECQTLHEKAIEVIHAIFQLMKGKDLVLYQTIIAEVIDLVKDLKILMEKVFLNESDEFNGNTFCIDRFQKDGADNRETEESFDEEKMQAKMVEIETFAQCDLLMSSCFTLLRRSVHGLCQYCGSRISELWRVIIFRLQIQTQNQPKEAVSLILSLLKTSGMISSVTIDELMKTLLSSVEYVVSSIDIIKRNAKNLQEYASILIEVFQYLFANSQSSSKPLFSSFELNNYLEKISDWLSNGPLNMEAMVEDKYQVLIFELVNSLLKVGMQGKGRLISRRTLLRLTQSLLDNPGYAMTTKMYVSIMISVFKALEPKDRKSGAKRTAAEMDSTIKRSVQSQRDKSGIGNASIDMLTEKLNQLFDALNSIFDHEKQQIKVAELLITLKAISALLQVFCHFKWTLSKEFAAGLDTTSCQIHSILHNPCFMTCSDKERTSILQAMIRIFNGVVTLFNCSKTEINGKPYDGILEMVYLPWVNSIDPPWFDWTPRLHTETELRSLYTRLQSSIDNQYIEMAIKMILKLSNKDHVQWKVHMFRTALTSPNIDTQRSAVRCLPGFLAVINRPSYCLLTEEIGPLVRSSRECVREELAKICGDVACVLANNCQVVFTTDEVDSRQGNSGSAMEYGYKVECNTCEEGKDNTSGAVSLLTSFFQILRQDASRPVKLAFIRNLKQLMNHILDEKEHTTTALWKLYLDFIDDPDVVIRISFSQAVSSFVKRSGMGHIQELLVNKLKMSFLKASSEGDTKILETVVLTLGSVGKTAEGDLLLVVVISLLECLITQHQSIGAVAYDQIHEVANYHKLKCKDLLLRFRSHVCDFLISKFREAIESGKDNNCVIEMIAETASVFELKDQKTFLQNNLKVLLPRVIRYADKPSSIILRIIAKQLDINRREMLFFNFKFIFSFLVRNCIGSELEKTLKYLQNETDVELGSLLLSECQSVFNQLLLYLSVNKDQVFTGLTILAHNDPTYKGPKEIKTNNQMANFLKPKLLGVLAFFNFVLTYSDMEERRLALQSLVSLMQLMGPAHVTVVRLKIMAILRLGMKIEESNFAELCSSAWDYFVHNVDLKTLGPLLGQILVTLFPLLDKFPEKVAAIFKFLIIDNKNAMKDFFKDIYFMPEHPVLKEINDVIQSSHMVIKSKRDYRDQLTLATEGAKHENSDVRKYALRRLAQLLADHQSYLLDFILASESVNPVVINLCSVLTNSCKEADKETRNLIGICFGHLGAVDPGRLEISSDRSGGDFIIYKNGIEDQQFAVDLINELCRAFLAASDTRAQVTHFFII